MEAYKSYCPDCKETYFWHGFKTGLGKSPEQLAVMKKRDTVCKYCGSENLQTGLDRETKLGKQYGDFDNFVALQIGGFIKRKLDDEQ